MERRTLKDFYIEHPTAISIDKWVPGYFECMCAGVEFIGMYFSNSDGSTTFALQTYDNNAPKSVAFNQNGSDFTNAKLQIAVIAPAENSEVFIETVLDFLLRASSDRPYTA